MRAKKPSKEWLEKAISDGHIPSLDYNEFEKIKKIGEGGFGSVYKYKWKRRVLYVALKRLKDDGDDSQDFVKELSLLRMGSPHPNIINFHGVTEDNDGYYNMVLECANDGNLRDYLKNNFETLQWIDKLHIAEEIVHGLIYLHDQNIVHRDFHSKNILINQGRPKIADFGLSKQIDESFMTSGSELHGMIEFVEPQCFIDPKYKRNIKSDIYSLGVILWEISSGRRPFQDSEFRLSLIYSILRGIREERIRGTPSKYIELYERCWDNDPNKRPETVLVYEDLKQLIEPSTMNRLDVQSNMFDEGPSTMRNSKSQQYSINGSSSQFYIPKEFIDLKPSEDKEPSGQPNKTTPPPNKNKARASSLDALQNKTSTNQNKKTRASSLDANLSKQNNNSLGSKIEITSNLNLNSRQIGPEEAKVLSQAIYNNSIFTLNLKMNKLNNEGIKILSEALSDNKTLIILDIGFNKISSEGAKSLAMILSKNRVLTTLKLCGNNLGSEGGKTLAEALRKNTNLSSLTLTNNKLGPEGGKAIADVLLKNTTLTSLSIGNNNLGPEGAKAFAKAINKNKTLTSLSIEKNQLGPEGGKELSKTLPNNTTLTYLDVKENEFDPATDRKSVV